MLGGIFEKNKIQNKIEEYEKNILSENFWKDKLSAQRIVKEKNFLSNILENFHFTEKELENLNEKIVLFKAYLTILDLGIGLKSNGRMDITGIF